ncbi:MAG: hypothetical protein IT429_25215 [Gemmataceae bacterium]|nr:hypothetical protein [Gemmataceae bacterium]
MPIHRFHLVAALTFTLALAVASAAQSPPSGGDAKKDAVNNSDLELVERLIIARREYQRMLEQLRAHYMTAGDLERTRWAEEELRQYHRIPKQAFRLELDVPPPTLQARENITEANKLITRALQYKDRGSGTDYIDNQRRAELLLQQLITQYPQCDKIGQAAYNLGDIYECKAYKQFRRAALYFERAFQWNPTAPGDARLRAARLYDRQMLDRGRAIELYREIISHETDPKRLDEANKRLQALSGGR